MPAPRLVTSLMLASSGMVAACGRIGFSDIAGAQPLELVPPVATINVGSKQAFEVVGGEPPFTFAVVGDGSISEMTFAAPTHAGQSIVRVTDANALAATATVSYEGAQLFVVGGYQGGSPIDTVLSSMDGVTWTMIGRLPAPRANGALVVYDDRMFYLGGYDPGDAARDEVFASSDGVTWTDVGRLPVPLRGVTGVVHDGAIWVVAGFTGSINSAAVFRSQDAASWDQLTPISIGRHEHDLISRGGRLYVVGGHGATYLDDVQWTSDGSQWSTAAGRLSIATDNTAAGELGDRVFHTCGFDCAATETSLDMETWTLAAPFPDGARDSPALIDFQGRLLVIGGASAVLATVDGSSWSTIGTLPGSRIRTAAVQFTPP